MKEQLQEATWLIGQRVVRNVLLLQMVQMVNKVWVFLCDSITKDEGKNVSTTLQ